MVYQNNEELERLVIKTILKIVAKTFPDEVSDSDSTDDDFVEFEPISSSEYSDSCISENESYKSEESEFNAERSSINTEYSEIESD